MARYQVQSTHSPEGCLQNLDEILALGPDTLQKWDFGCAVGDHSNHVCYAIQEGADANAVRATLPERIRGEAEITEVGKFTAEQIRSYHN